MRVSLLYGKHKGEDIYVVGSGPSLRYYHPEFFRGRITIGLNRAYCTIQPTYTITAHPDLFAEYLSIPEGKRVPTSWIVKAFKPPLRLTFEDPRCYVFRAGAPHDGHQLRFLREQCKDEYLYQGRGIHQTAMNLAAHMGARTIFLVGCDMCALTDEHHASDQPTKFLGLPPERVYKEYRLFTDHVRQVLRDELGIHVVSLSPFLGLNSVEEDSARLRTQLRLRPLPPAKDVSTYQRSGIDSP